MKLKFTLFCFLLSFSITILSGQDFQGKAYYQTKTTMDMEQWSSRQLTPEQKKRIQDRMKSFLEKQFVLTFNREASLYKEEERLEAPGTGGGFGRFGNSFTAGPKYKNVKSKELLQDQEFFGKQFLIKDSLVPLQWKMTNETKKIGNYVCFKAVATKEITGFDWRSMRRRPKKKESDSLKSNTPIDEIEMPKTMEVIAWYTPQIPVNQGPDDYWGLPGLILEINADRTTMLCTKIVINPEEKEIIKKPYKGDEVTQKEYTEIITKKMQEMREMYRGRRGRRN